MDITREASPAQVLMCLDDPAAKAALEARVEQAKQAMGAKWVGHPAYVTNPRHSLNPEIWKPARWPFLQAIAAAAQADRERNPAWRTAQRILAAVNAPQALQLDERRREQQHPRSLYVLRDSRAATA